MPKPHASSDGDWERIEDFLPGQRGQGNTLRNESRLLFGLREADGHDGDVEVAKLNHLVSIRPNTAMEILVGKSSDLHFVWHGWGIDDNIDKPITAATLSTTGNKVIALHVDVLLTR